ncbi:MAG: hypothetical protein FD129_780, partial [bacterium]
LADREPGPDSRLILVLVHGFKGFKDWGHFPFVAGRLAETGVPVVSFNLSGSGIGEHPEKFTELDRFRENTLTREVADLDLVLEALKADQLPGTLAGHRRFILLGHSRGAIATTVIAGRRPDIVGLVNWAGVGVLRDRYPEEVRRDWRANGELPVVNGRTGQLMPIGLQALDDLESHLDDYSPRHLASALVVPHLLIHGDADSSVPAAESEAVAAASGGRTRLVVLPGADHTFGSIHPFAGEGPHLTRALALTREFIEMIRGTAGPETGAGREIPCSGK